MKRFLILFCLSVLLGGAVHAQRYGETVDIRRRMPGFYYSGWWANHEMDSTQLFHKMCMPSWSYYRYHYSEIPMRVKGIAAVICNHVRPNPENSNHPLPFYDSTLAPEYLMLCEASPNTFDTIASVLVDVRDTHRYMARVVYDLHYPCCLNHLMPDTEYLPLYTFYFDKPVVVYDSFYVGVTMNSEIRYEEAPFLPPFVSFSLAYWENPFPNCSDSCSFHDKGIVESYGRVIYADGSICSGMIYPIAEPDTCHWVDGLRVVESECGEGVELAWDADDQHIGWEVAYGPVGTPPDSCTVVQCDTTSVVLDSVLAGGRYYTAYVRGVCGNENVQYYSEWSDGIEVLFHNKYNVEAASNDPSRGSVYGGGEYCDGDTAELSAQSWRFYFLKWSDGNKENPRRVVVTQDTSFTAIFGSRPDAIETVPEGEAGFSLMPNPAWGSVSCVLHDSGLVGGTLTVVNALGQEVFREVVELGNRVVELPIADIPQGVYFVTLTTSRQTTMQKLLVKQFK